MDWEVCSIDDSRIIAGVKFDVKIVEEECETELQRDEEKYDAELQHNDAEFDVKKRKHAHEYDMELRNVSK